MPVSRRTREQWKSGVYLITNTVNGKVYVGSAAKSIKLRWIRHRRLLRAKEHSNRHLQNAWDKYGESAFKFSVLLPCAADDCVRYEQIYIDKRNSSDREFGYNLSPTAGSCLGVIHTTETRARMSNAHKGRKKSPEHAAKVAESNRGRKRSAETKAKLSAIHKGKKLSAETIAKIVATKIGVRLSDEHKAKLSEAARKRSGDCYKKGWETRRRIATE